MTHGEIQEQVEHLLCTPRGTIARRTIETLPGGKKGSTVEDIRPAALAMIRATHGRGCVCPYCS